MTQPGFSIHGAVDLSALARRSSPPAGSSGAAANGGSAGAGGPAPGVVIDVTEATFQAEVIERSMTVPVVIDLWAEWCGPCKQLSPVLEKLAAEYAGRWVLAKIDVDAEQRLAAAFGVQSIPSVFAVLKGQPVPLFQGAIPEAQARQVIDQVLAAAAQNGITGTVPADAGAPGKGQPQPAEPVEEPLDPDVAEAQDAVERGDYAAAAAAYRRVLDRAPADAEAKAALIQVELLARTDGADPAQARAAAAARPHDVEAQCLAADLDLIEGDVEGAFARLVQTVRATSGAEREQARAHLVELFEAVGQADPRVAKARTALTTALF